MMAKSPALRGLFSVTLLLLLSLLCYHAAQFVPAHEALPLLARDVMNGTSKVNTTKLYARDNEFDECFNKGTGIQCRLSRWNIPPGSEFRDYAALQHYGWTADERPTMEFPSDIAPALQGLGLAGVRDPYTFIQLDQDGPFTNPDGQHGGPTGAYYGQFFDAATGAILCTNMRSPAKMPEISRDVPAAGPFPALQRWSDLVWLEWTNQCARRGASPANLNVVLHYRIVTRRTLGVIRQVLQRAGTQLAEWPGTEISATTPSGAALVGTPHGLGIGWLLADHRVGGVLSKRVESVVIFATDPRTMDQEVHLAFNLGPI